MTRVRRRPPSQVLVGLVITILALTPSPRAEAVSRSPDWSQVTYRVTYASCPGSAGDYNPRGQIKLFEYGKSGVIAFKARYQLRAAEGGIAWQLANYDTTYSSTRVPNDWVSYQIRLPGNGYHEWRDIVLQPRLDVKATWDRVWWKPDWKTQRTVVIC
jgi:hypothetical protein